MRPSDPELAIANRESSVLLEELCLALRDVGVWDATLTTSERGLESIRRVTDIDRELVRRHVDSDERLEALSAETGWNMGELLEQCRAFPRVRPRLRERDGVRRAFRCSACRTEEYPEGDLRFALCDKCLGTLENALEDPRDLPNMFIYRSFTALDRCAHADSDTVLGIYPWFGAESEFTVGACHRCVVEEFQRRGAE